MGSAASLPDKIDQDTAKQYAESKWSEDEWNALEKDDAGCITKEVFLGLGKINAEAAVVEEAKEIIATVDANGDGKVTSDELPAEAIAAVDANGDGVIEVNEVVEDLKQAKAEAAEAAVVEEAKEIIAAVDANGDGKVTSDELPAEAIAAVDANGDGVVEVKEVVEELKQEKAEAAVEEEAKEIIATVDADGDGKVTSDEVPAEVIAAVDQNGDGVVEVKEVVEELKKAE